MTLGNRYKSGITNEKWDAIIIGSGIGGLTSARLLADAGKKVLVLEKHFNEDEVPYEDAKKIASELVAYLNEVSQIVDFFNKPDEIRRLKDKVKNSVVILKKPVDSGEILGIIDAFVGSGGTMTAEAALRGIPTFSYNAIPNIIEDYLVRKKLVTRVNNINKLDKIILNVLNNNSGIIKNRALKEFKNMENPIKKLALVLETIRE